MKYDVFTLFPDILGSFKEYSIIGRGCDRGIISINPIDIRVYTEDKHKRVDDYPYGGGYGMVMQAEPVSNALEATYPNGKMPDKLLYMSAKGRKMDADYCKELSHLDNIALLWRWRCLRSVRSLPIGRLQHVQGLRAAGPHLRRRTPR